MAEIILSLAGALILAGLLASVARLAIGRSLIDRIVAIDVLTIISISLIGLLAHLSGRFLYLDVALVYGGLSFLAVLALARYLERGL